ncbi:hypothetical protein ACFOLL_11285 [Falsochrobactrum ovis]|uniref:Uncharacterized protein n=1 Tax=Falsochrobactrum ovis TaxID=1293442 RepID=A0A364JS10_9HYPH|nr:hypothetical protein [Falsochrobactrum ovis]RAK25749.1 hypothetical protein C7374_12032 [Falsochrobactrum ovis]
MNPLPTNLHSDSLLSSMADAGLASREATQELFGDRSALRASDLHRLIEAQIVDADALASFLSSYYGVQLLRLSESRYIDLVMLADKLRVRHQEGRDGPDVAKPLGIIRH